MPPFFYADDYEVVRQFDPVITPTRESVSFQGFLTKFQESVASKNYPFSVKRQEMRWRTQGGKGKPRIVIQPIHEAKWQRIMMPIAVEQLGDDTTIKLSVLRKNEMAEFYYATLDSIGTFTSKCTEAAQPKISDNARITEKEMNIIEKIAKIFRLDINNSQDWEKLKQQIHNLGRAAQEGSASDESFAKIISRHTGLNINKVVASENDEPDLMKLEFQLLGENRLERAMEHATYLCANMQFMGCTTGDFGVDYKINWQDAKKYQPVIDQAILFFAEKIETILARYKPGDINQAKGINAALISYINTFLIINPQFKNYCEELLKEGDKKSLLENERELLNTDKTGICKKIDACSKNISAKINSLLSAQKKKVFFVIGAIITFIYLLAKGGGFLLSLGVGGGIVGVWKIWCFVLQDGVATLEYELKKHQGSEANIYSQMSRKSEKISNINGIIATKRKRLIDTISNEKIKVFQHAEQNEQKWREPSFADEELEQLIAIIKNLFNNITGKLTAKKKTNDLKMHSTSGLGGMGFDE